MSVDDPLGLGLQHLCAGQLPTVTVGGSLGDRRQSLSQSLRHWETRAGDDIDDKA